MENNPFSDQHSALKTLPACYFLLVSAKSNSNYPRSRSLSYPVSSPSNPICSPCLSIYSINIFQSPTLCLVPYRPLRSPLQVPLTNKTLSLPSPSPSLSAPKPFQQPSPLLDHYKSKLIFTTVLSTFTQYPSNSGSLSTMYSTMWSLKALLLKVWRINYTLQQQVSPGSCLEMQNLTTKPEF